MACKTSPMQEVKGFTSCRSSVFLKDLVFLLANPYQIQYSFCPCHGGKCSHINHSMRGKEYIWDAISDSLESPSSSAGDKGWNGERSWLHDFIPHPGDNSSLESWISFVTCFFSLLLPLKVLWARLITPGWFEIKPGVRKPLLSESRRPFLGAPSPLTNKTRAWRSLRRTLLGKIGLINLVWPLSLGDRKKRGLVQMQHFENVSHDLVINIYKYICYISTGWPVYFYM